MQRASTACTTVEAIDVECTHCGVRMTSHTGGGGTIRYFHCPSCSRSATSMYSEVFRADSKMRMRKPSAEPRVAMGSVKQRLESWLAAIAVADPYRALGVSPEVSDGALRERYLTLARQHHPDRGGDADQMRRINDAYERVLADRAQRRLAPGGAPRLALDVG